jgi:hypothetical protein
MNGETGGLRTGTFARAFPYGTGAMLDSVAGAM